MSLNINYKSSPPLIIGEHVNDEKQALNNIKSELFHQKNHIYNLEGVDPNIDARKIFLFIESKRSNETA